MDIDNIWLFDREARRKIARETGLSACSGGFMDLQEMVPVSDVFALAMVLEKRTKVSALTIMDVLKMIPWRDR